MLNRRGQANIIVILGMIAATVYIVLTGFNYISNVGLSSNIAVTAQNSIYQTLALKDYIIQQANYNFQKAQLLEGINLAPSFTSGVNCGYINSSNLIPFAGVPKVYYWRNLNGQVCLPNNQEIVYGIESILNQLDYSTINTSNITVTTNLVLNLSLRSSGLFSGNFSTPALPDSYLFTYNRTNSSVSICRWNKTSCYSGSPDVVFSGPVGSDLTISGKSFSLQSEEDTVTGALTQSVATNAFFANSGVSPSGQFTISTFPNGNMAVIYSTTSASGTYQFNLTPLLNQNAYSLNSVKQEDAAAGQPTAITLTNNSNFVFDGVEYHFIISSSINGAFEIYPVNYAMVPLQPKFVYYKYSKLQFQTASVQNLLFPSNRNLYISFSMFPLYNAQVCLSYNDVQFTLQNCMSLAGYIDSQDYLSQIMQLGNAFVNQSFPLGNGNIEGFAQYTLDNYLFNVVKGVNLKTVSVNGRPQYDWYSALILALGSPQGTNYLLNQLNRVKEPYYGRYIYDCSQNASDMQFCRNLLETTLSQNIRNLFENTIPQELTYLSGTSFNINVLNLSISANESSSCSNYNLYNASSNYGFQVNNTVAPSENYTEEVLGVPISINFGYQNRLQLSPSESCGIQNSPYKNGYPGFTQALVTSSNTYLNCAQIPARVFLNNTCIASLETTDASLAQQIDQSSAIDGHACQQLSQNNKNYYYCPFYNFTISSYKNWITSGNSCPNYLVVYGKNFTTSGNSNYVLVSDYGGGVKHLVSNYNNWSMALINGSNAIVPSNFSLHVGFEFSGPNPQINVLFGTRASLQGGFYSVGVQNSGEPAAMYNYSQSGKISTVSTSSIYAPVNSSSQIIVNGYCTDSACGSQFSVNSANGTEFKTNSIPYSSDPINLLGVSTGLSSTSDLINYMFATSYVPNYTAISSEFGYQSVSLLSGRFRQAFGITATSNTFYNQIILNPLAAQTNDYQLQLVLNQNFNYGALSPGQIKIFGYYSSSNTTKQLYWWNQTSLTLSGQVWVNLGKAIPNSVYIVYGQGATDSSVYSDNGSMVFPVFFSNSSSTSQSPFDFYYPSSSTKGVSASVPSFYEGNLNLTDETPISPYIYNSTLRLYYSQFACISTSPSFELTLLNATYSPYPVQFNIGSLYNTQSPLYPDLAVIGQKTYNSWPN